MTVLRRSDTLNKGAEMHSAVHFYSSKVRSLRFSEDDNLRKRERRDYRKLADIQLTERRLAL